MPEEIWATPYEDFAHGEWDESKWVKCPFVENDKRPEYETKFTRSDLVPSKELLEKVCNALRYFSDDDPESADNCVVRQALALIEPFVRENAQ